jgi:hypothetical protein
MSTCAPLLALSPLLVNSKEPAALTRTYWRFYLPYSANASPEELNALNNEKREVNEATG